MVAPLTLDTKKLNVQPRGSWVLLEKIDFELSTIILTESAMRDVQLFKVQALSTDPVYSMTGVAREHMDLKVGDYVIPSSAKGVDLPGVENVFLCQEHEIILTLEGPE